MEDETAATGGSAIRTRVVPLLVLAALATAVAVVLSLLSVPSPTLFGGLLAGMTLALTIRRPPRLPAPAFRAAQGVIGVVIGALVTVEALGRTGREALPIALVTLGTLAASVVAGRLLALRRDVTPVTGVFALVAGGASGVVAVSRDLGADDRVVTVVQYLRVLLVLLAMPVVASAVFRPDHTGDTMARAGTSWPADLAFVAISVAVGLAVARVVPIATASLLAPLVVAVVIANSGWLGTVTVPDPVAWVGYTVIGAQVGLRFTRASLRSIAAMLPVVTLLIVGVIAVCAGFGALLAWLTPVDGLTAYLATTPGGLFAVLATAADGGSDVTYVMAVQLVRLLAILLLLPVAERVLRRSAPAGADGRRD